MHNHRQEALSALDHFREEVRRSGIPEAKLQEILSHLDALEQEVKNPEPEAHKIAASRTFLEDVTESPSMADSIAKVVRFFNSIGIQ